MLVSMRVAQIYCACRWGWPYLYCEYLSSYDRYFFPHEHKWSHFVQMGHVEFSCHSLFCVQLTAWFSLCAHQLQLLAFQQFWAVFDVTRFICRLGFCRWMWSIFIAISGVSYCVRISLQIHRRRAQLTGSIRTQLTDCIRTHHSRHLLVTIEVVDTEINVTCFTWESVQKWSWHGGTLSRIVTSAFFCQIMQRSTSDFWTYWAGSKGNTPFIFAPLRICHKHQYDLRLPKKTHYHCGIYYNRRRALR